MSDKVYNNKNNLGHYLAGLWHGDGNIKKGYPKPTLHITFNITQLPYVKKLHKVLTNLCGAKAGSILKHGSRNACYLNIFKYI
jgi:hypothetical protein